VVGAVYMLARFFDLHDLGWAAVAGSTATIAMVATAAASFPAWRATHLSPMAAIRDESQSAWESARVGIERALGRISRAMTESAEPAALSGSALLADLVASTRRAGSPAEQLQMALAALQRHLGAEWARLFESSEGQLRCTVSAPVQALDDSLPADGFFAGRLAITNAALVMTSG